MIGIQKHAGKVRKNMYKINNVFIILGMYKFTEGRNFHRTIVQQCNGEKANVMATLCAEARSIDQTFLKSYDTQW